MDLRNTNPINLKNNNEDYELQIVDWYDYNEDCNDSDSETEEEYNAVVTTEYIETVFVDFMAKRMGGKVFNEEHNEDIKPPSYILETWLVEDPETDKSKTVYGLDVPKGTWFAVQQFTDKDVYKD